MSVAYIPLVFALGLWAGLLLLECHRRRYLHGAASACVVSMTAAFLFPDVHNLHAVKDQVLGLVGSCSFLHSFLPPWSWEPDFLTEGLSDFPTVQKIWRSFFGNRWYKLLIYVIGYAAMNARSTVWKNSISMSKQFEKMKPGNL